MAWWRRRQLAPCPAHAGSFARGHETGGDHRPGQGRHAQLVELSQVRSGLDDVELGVSADVGQAQLPAISQPPGAGQEAIRRGTAIRSAMCIRVFCGAVYRAG